MENVAFGSPVSSLVRRSPTLAKLLAAVGLSVSLACASSPTSVAAAADSTSEPVSYASNANPGESRAFLVSGPLTQAECNPIPTPAEVQNGQWTYRDQLRTASEAVTMGIPVVNVSGSRNLMVFVRDYQRAKPCTSPDGSELLYGQVIRAVIELAEYDASLGTSLAAIAATGTLNRKNQYFHLYKDGFFHPDIDKIIASVSGKAFDVQNYADYQAVVRDLVGLLSDPTTRFSVNKIAVKPTGNDPSLNESAAVAYALTGIEKRVSCEDTTRRHRGDSSQGFLIQRTYEQVTGACGSTRPNEDDRTRAAAYLNGVRARW